MPFADVGNRYWGFDRPWLNAVLSWSVDDSMTAGMQWGGTRRRPVRMPVFS